MKRKFKIRVLPALLMLFVFLLSTCVWASPKIKDTDYEGKGKVEVEFSGKVQYKNLKLTVTDKKGNKVSAKIVDKDSDDVTFKISNYKEGQTYYYKLSGVRRRGESKYTSVSGKVKIPKAPGGIPIHEVEYDRDDKEVSIEFDTDVEWKKPKVTITKDSVNYVRKIDDTDDDEIEVKVKALKKGTNYTCTISGIRAKGSSKYQTITFTFTA